MLLSVKRGGKGSIGHIEMDTSLTKEALLLFVAVAATSVMLDTFNIYTKFTLKIKIQNIK